MAPMLFLEVLPLNSSLSVTALYLGIHLLHIVGLSLLVVRQRVRAKVGLGVGQESHGALARAVRVHANQVEHAPMAFIMLALLELQGSPTWLIHALGIVFTLARLGHAFGLSKNAGRSMGRYLGTLGTWCVYTVGAISCFLVFFND